MKTTHKKRKYTKDILTIVVAIVLILFLYIGPRFLLATDTPLIGITTGSMSPAIQVGDLVIVQGVQPEEIKIGDIIIFDPPTEGIGRTAHRVIDIRPLANGTLTFKTKGDANDIEDQYTVYPQNVHGRVIYRIPYIGYVFLDPLILVIIMTIIVVIIILWPENKRRFHHKRKKHILKVG